MSSNVSAVDTPETSIHTGEYHCVLDHARAVCTEALADLAGTTLDAHAQDLKHRPEFWVGQLQFLMGYLLIAIDEADV